MALVVGETGVDDVSRCHSSDVRTVEGKTVNVTDDVVVGGEVCSTFGVVLVAISSFSVCSVAKTVVVFASGTSDFVVTRSIFGTVTNQDVFSVVEMVKTEEVREIS